MERDLCHQRHASPRFVAERGTRVQETAARRELHAQKWERFQQAHPQAFRRRLRPSSNRFFKLSAGRPLTPHTKKHLPQ